MAFIYTDSLGLGRTVPELDISSFSSAGFEKTEFSMYVPEVQEYLKTNLPEVYLLIISLYYQNASILITV